MKHHAFIFLLLCGLSSCILFKKEVQQSVTVNIIETSVTPQTIAKAIVPKYCYKVNPQQLLDSFWVGFYREAAITKNVNVLRNDPNCQLNLSLKSFSVTETGKLDTIRNPNSKYNNEVLELCTIECKVEMSYKNNSRPNLSETFSDSKNQSEQLSNNRTLDEVFSGQNKDKNIYHVKLLDPNAYYHLAERLGHRMWVPITRHLSRMEH